MPIPSCVSCASLANDWCAEKQLFIYPLVVSVLTHFYYDYWLICWVFFNSLIHCLSKIIDRNGKKTNHNFSQLKLTTAKKSKSTLLSSSVIKTERSKCCFLPSREIQIKMYTIKIYINKKKGKDVKSWTWRNLMPGIFCIINLLSNQLWWILLSVLILIM